MHFFLQFTCLGNLGHLAHAILLFPRTRPVGIHRLGCQQELHAAIGEFIAVAHHFLLHRLNGRHIHEANLLKANQLPAQRAQASKVGHEIIHRLKGCTLHLAKQPLGILLSLGHMLACLSFKAAHLFELINRLARRLSDVVKCRHNVAAGFVLEPRERVGNG